MIIIHPEQTYVYVNNNNKRESENHLQNYLKFVLFKVRPRWILLLYWSLELYEMMHDIFWNIVSVENEYLP